MLQLLPTIVYCTKSWKQCEICNVQRVRKWSELLQIQYKSLATLASNWLTLETLAGRLVQFFELFCDSYWNEQEIEQMRNKTRRLAGTEIRCYHLYYSEMLLSKMLPSTLKNDNNYISVVLDTHLRDNVTLLISLKLRLPDWTAVSITWRDQTAFFIG